LFSLVAVACGGLAGHWLARPVRTPLPPVHDQAFRLAERERDPLRVTVARPLLLPYCFGDCDLLATVAVPAGGELDVALRRLDLAGGHGRFALLRLSATDEGWPWRTREQALFGAESGGARVAPGLPASIRLEVRGKTARANVAGRWLPPFATDDDRGSFAFVVRGGEAEVSHLQVLPLSRSELPYPAWIAGALCGLALSLASRARGRARARWWRSYAALLLLPLLCGAARALLTPALVVGAEVGTPGLLCLLAAAAVAGLALAHLGRPRALAWLGLGVLGAGLAFEGFCRLEQRRLVALLDPRLDLYFGLDSRQAPFDALAKLLHGKNAVHTADPQLGRAIVPGTVDTLRLVFLGGEAMMEANLDRAQHLAVQATAVAAQRLGRRCEAAVFPTSFPNTLQQTLLFSRFYADAYPAACVVLGIDRWDAQREGRLSVRQRSARLASGPPREPWCLALDVLRGTAGDVPIASPEEVAATVGEFARFCRERELPLVLATHGGLAEPYAAAVEEVATAAHLVLVRAAMRADDTADADALGAAVAQAVAP